MILAARITMPIAALFLATGAAHAGFPHYYQCGEFSYYEQAFTGTPGQFEIAGPLPTKGPIVFRETWRKNILYVNGRRCVQTDEDGKPIQ